MKVQMRDCKGLQLATTSLKPYHDTLSKAPFILTNGPW